jgi:S1-C subfamily serine protease
MLGGALQSLVQVSDSISFMVAEAAPSLVAIRIGLNGHIAGFIWRDDLVVTSERALPAQDVYTLALPNGVLRAARPLRRHPVAGIAVLQLDASEGIAAMPQGAAAIGGLVLALGAEADASPTVRLTLIQRLVRGASADGPAIVMDLAGNTVDQGGPVLDARGGLIGMAGIGARGEGIVLPYAAIARTIDGDPEVAAIGQPPPIQRLPIRPSPIRPHAAPNRAPPPIPFPPPNPPSTSGRRGWLGVALQPITVPEPLVDRAGQESGRMVMSLTQGGPADKAGLRVGDVLLSLDGHSASGPNALRAFMGADRIGTRIEVRLMRGGVVVSAQLTVAEPPGA